MIEERERKYRSVLETSPVGIIRLDVHGQNIYVNRQAEITLGIQRSDAEGRIYSDPAWQVTDLEGRPLPEENIPFCIVQKTGKAVFGVQHGVHRADGSKVLLSANAMPLFDDNGDFNGVVAICPQRKGRR